MSHIKISSIIFFLFFTACSSKKESKTLINYDGEIYKNRKVESYKHDKTYIDSYSQTVSLVLEKKYFDFYRHSFLVFNKGEYIVYGKSKNEIKTLDIRGFGFFKSKLKSEINVNKIKEILLNKNQIKKSYRIDSSNYIIEITGVPNEKIKIKELQNVWLIYFD